jgi:hypothetical protein
MDAPVQHKLLSLGPLACTNKQFYTEPKHSRSAHSAEWQGNREARSSRCRRLLLADCRTCGAGARAWPDLGNQIQQGRVTHETRDENEPLSACFERVKRRGVTCRLLRCWPAAPPRGTSLRHHPAAAVGLLLSCHAHPKRSAAPNRPGDQWAMACSHSFRRPKPAAPCCPIGSPSACVLHPTPPTSSSHQYRCVWSPRRVGAAWFPPLLLQQCPGLAQPGVYSCLT